MQCQSVLIVEDDEDIREILEEILKVEGYRVYGVKNGKEAMIALKRIPGPPLILLDLMMPVMNGWEFLEAQKSNAVLAPMPVVVVSTISAAKALADGKLSSAKGYLKKPIPYEGLLEIVRQYCGVGRASPVDSPVPLQDTPIPA